MATIDRLTAWFTGEKSDPPGKSPTPNGDADSSRSDLAALKGTGPKAPKAERGTGGTSKAQERIKEIQLAETLEKLFEPKNFKPIGKLYFNTRYGITGWEGFLLTPAEEESIAASFAMLTEAFWLWDPRLLALIIAGGNIGSIVAQKEITYSKLDAVKKQNAAQVQR